MAGHKTKVAATNSTSHYVRGKTRDGVEVRIYADDAGGDYPIHGAWRYEAETRWIPHAWSMDGCVIGPETPRGLDLNVKTLKFPKGTK